MKLTYMKPDMQITAVGMANIIMVSGGNNNNDPNQVKDGGTGVNTGGYSQEGGSTEGEGNTVGDMAKYHKWTSWEE